jgi:ubiquinone/menaquinone biosynthesis C-methylase UbiE
MASGPIQYKEYLQYSMNFSKRYCVDLSSSALESAEKKIGDHGVFLHGSFFDLDLEENFFDCAVSLHTIYHMDKDRQEEAVRKLIRVTRPGKPVIIVYSNPDTIISSIMSSLPIRALGKAGNLLKRPVEKTGEGQDENVYFHPHPIEWWDRFGDVASVKILPWRSFSSTIQKKLIPNNKIGGVMFNLLFNLEERYPGFFVKHFKYPMIILTKMQN